MPTIKELRTQAGWTQLQFANMLEVTPGTVASWERGASEPRLSMARRIARLFDISLDDLETAGRERSGQ